MNPIPPGAPSRFDAILAAIGLIMLASVGVGWLSAVPLRIAGSAGSILASIAMLDGLLWHPPDAEK